jgi:LCP family protein required for cell wall assembly
VLTEVVSAAVAPGWNARRRSTELAGGLLALGCGAPLLVAGWAVWSGRSWVALTLDSSFLALVVVAGAAAVAARLIAIAEVWWAHGRPTDLSLRTGGALVIGLATCLLLGAGVVEVGRARAALGPAFASSLDEPLFDAAPPPATAVTHPDVAEPVAGSTAPPTTAVDVPLSGSRSDTSASRTTTTLAAPAVPARPSSGIDPALHPDVTTILLLGGDAGPGRWSLRTDTMMLFSIHRPSGRASLISIPRNLERVLSPPDSALGEAYPHGFTDLANAIYPIVQSRGGLRDQYDVLPGVEPGVVALGQALGYSLDVTIDDYVLVDMRGFVSLVDALGGVTVDVPRAVPMPGNIPGAPTQYPDVVGPGSIHMDGTMALGYARSRSGDSDYQRTARQRHLLAALARQVSPSGVLGSYQSVASALGDSLRTSLTPDELAHTLAVIGGETAIVESVGLVPPLVNVKAPVWNELARIVAEVQVAVATGRPSGL